MVDLSEQDTGRSGGGSAGHEEKPAGGKLALTVTSVQPDPQELLAGITEAVKKAKQANVPVKDIADAVYNGVGLIFGENPFDRSSKGQPGWGNGR